jgi:GNAT superfamily N-acetyltransferase
MAASYAYRDAETGKKDMAALASLFSAVWPSAEHLREPYLKWLYADNPSGPVIGMNAWSNGLLVAHYAVVPIRAVLDGTEVNAALSLNTAVHPEHQGRGLFTTLASETYSRAKLKGVDHIIGVANANSTPGFIKRLDFQLVAPLEAKVVWGLPRIADGAPQRLPSWQRSWPDGEIAWRLRNPCGRYSIWVHRHSAECLAAVGAYGLQAVLKVLPAVKSPCAIPKELRRRHLWSIRLWIGLGKRVIIPPWSGIDLPAKFRRSPLNLIYRSLSRPGHKLNRDTVEFELADFDAY